MTLAKVSYTASFILLAGTSLSWANVISESQSFGPTTTNWGTSTSDTSFAPTQTLSFSGFNPSQGTLSAVILTITEGVSGSVNLTNDGSTSSGVQGSLFNTAKTILPGVSTSGHPSYSVQILDQSSSYSATLAAGASSGSQPVVGTSTVTKTLINPSLTSLYTVPWSATVGDLGAVLVSSANGNGRATYSDLGEVTITASYSYTPAVTPTVPEPAALGLLGVGLAGLGVIRRRRK